MAKSTCGGCSAVFWSIRSFDSHRTGSYGRAIFDENGKTVEYTRHERRCLTEGEMLAKNMVKNEHGVWTMGVDMSGVWKAKETSEVA